MLVSYYRDASPVVTERFPAINFFWPVDISRISLWNIKYHLRIFSVEKGWETLRNQKYLSKSQTYGCKYHYIATVTVWYSSVCCILFGRRDGRNFQFPRSWRLEFYALHTCSLLWTTRIYIRNSQQYVFFTTVQKCGNVRIIWILILCMCLCATPLYVTGHAHSLSWACAKIRPCDWNHCLYFSFREHDSSWEGIMKTYFSRLHWNLI